MRIFLYISLMFHGVIMMAQTNGYVLQNTDGSIRIQDSSITVNKISGLRQFIANNLKTINNTAVWGVGNISLLAPDGNGSSLTGITKTQVGLANADNTSDANKPISTATQTALNNKSTYYVGLDAGANDSYVITASPTPSAYTQGMIVLFRANTQNTTGCTINVNSLGAKTIVKRVNTTPATGDILSQMWTMLIYDGTNFVILNPIVN